MSFQKSLITCIGKGNSYILSRDFIRNFQVLYNTIDSIVSTFIVTDRHDCGRIKNTVRTIRMGSERTRISENASSQKELCRETSACEINAHIYGNWLI